MTPTPHPPSCDDIIVGEIEWYGDLGIEIAPVTNTHPTAQLMHKRTDLDWAWIYVFGHFLSDAYFAKPSGAVVPIGAYQPPVGREIDVPFKPGETAPFRAVWHPWNGGFYPGHIEIRFRFEYPEGGPTCEYVRTIVGSYPPTITPTMTPTNTPTIALTMTPTPRTE
jgi:hypothetical protein